MHGRHMKVIFILYTQLGGKLCGAAENKAVAYPSYKYFGLGGELEFGELRANICGIKNGFIYD